MDNCHLVKGNGPKVLALGFFTFLFLLPCNSLAKDNFVIFNEIAWMGTSLSANDEWLELYNNSDSDIDLSGWKIIADDGSPNIALEKAIPGRGFYLLERTDDQAVPNAAANQIYTGALENNGEVLRIFDKDNLPIEEINAGGGWPAGDNSTKQTMERTGLGFWATSQEINGTPGKENSVNLFKSLPKASASVLATPRPDYPQGVIFNEILPSPSGSDKTDEWIELYNQNDFSVNLTGWQIKDSFGRTKTYYFPKNSVVFPQSYLIIKREESGIVLNNQEEMLLLVNPDNETVDSVHYKDAVSNLSFANFAGQWAWTKVPTPANLNILEEESSLTNRLEEKKEIPLTASVLASNAKEENSQSLKAFGSAVLIAALSGIAILMLKRVIRDI